MKAKKLVSILLAGAMVLSMAACGSKSPAPAADGSAASEVAASEVKAETVEEALEETGMLKTNVETDNTQVTDETIVIEFGSLPSFLWAPGAAQNGTNEEQMIGAAIFDRLIELDETTNEIVPSLATSWEWIDDYSLQFNLRDDVTMLDGTPLVADDVVYSALTWKDRCASNDTGRYIDSAEAIDEHTVVIHFNSVAPELLKMLTWSNFSIVSEDEVNALGGYEEASMNPKMGSGRYIFKEWKDSEYIILERNDNYWDDNYKGYFKTIKIVPVNDSGSKVAAVQSGDADVAYDMPVAQAATFRADESVRTYIYSDSQVQHLWFNLREDHVTSDINVRQAISKALNRDALAQVATAGLGSKALSYTSPVASYYTETATAEELTRDVEGAKALLAEAGYADGIEITTITLPDLVDAYTVIQANLADAGISLKIETTDMGGFVPAMLQDKSYDIVLVGDLSAFRTPQLTQFVREGVVFGGPAVVLPEHEALLTELMQATTDDEARDLLIAYDELVRKDMVCVNAYCQLKSSIVGSDIKGFSLRERGYIEIASFYK